MYPIISILTSDKISSSPEACNNKRHQLQYIWTNNKVEALRPKLVSINRKHNSPIKVDIPQDITVHNFEKFRLLKIHIASLRNLIRIMRNQKENDLKCQNIQYYETLRCDNYMLQKTKFIASALNRSKRSIILDRAMSISPNG